MILPEGSVSRDLPLGPTSWGSRFLSTAKLSTELQLTNLPRTKNISTGAIVQRQKTEEKVWEKSGEEKRVATFGGK